MRVQQVVSLLNVDFKLKTNTPESSAISLHRLTNPIEAVISLSVAKNIQNDQTIYNPSVMYSVQIHLEKFVNQQWIQCNANPIDTTKESVPPKRKPLFKDYEIHFQEQTENQIYELGIPVPQLYATSEGKSLFFQVPVVQVDNALPLNYYVRLKMNTSKEKQGYKRGEQAIFRFVFSLLRYEYKGTSQEPTVIIQQRNESPPFGIINHGKNVKAAIQYAFNKLNPQQIQEHQEFQQHQLMQKSQPSTLYNYQPEDFMALVKGDAQLKNQLKNMQPKSYGYQELKKLVDVLTVYNNNNLRQQQQKQQQQTIQHQVQQGSQQQFLQQQQELMCQQQQQELLCQQQQQELMCQQQQQQQQQQQMELFRQHQLQNQQQQYLQQHGIESQFVPQGSHSFSPIYSDSSSVTNSSDDMMLDDFEFQEIDTDTFFKDEAFASDNNFADIPDFNTDDVFLDADDLYNELQQPQHSISLPDVQNSENITPLLAYTPQQSILPQYVLQDQSMDFGTFPLPRQNPIQQQQQQQPSRSFSRPQASAYGPSQTFTSANSPISSSTEKEKKKTLPTKRQSGDERSKKKLVWSNFIPPSTIQKKNDTDWPKSSPQVKKEHEYPPQLPSMAKYSQPPQSNGGHLQLRAAAENVLTLEKQESDNLARIQKNAISTGKNNSNKEIEEKRNQFNNLMLRCESKSSDDEEEDESNEEEDKSNEEEDDKFSSSPVVIPESKIDVLRVEEMDNNELATATVPIVTALNSHADVNKITCKEVNDKVRFVIKRQDIEKIEDELSHSLSNLSVQDQQGDKKVNVPVFQEGDTIEVSVENNLSEDKGPILAMVQFVNLEGVNFASFNKSSQSGTPRRLYNIFTEVTNGNCVIATVRATRREGIQRNVVFATLVVRMEKVAGNKYFIIRRRFIVIPRQQV